MAAGLLDTAVPLAWFGVAAWGSLAGTDLPAAARAVIAERQPVPGRGLALGVDVRVPGQGLAGFQDRAGRAVATAVLVPVGHGLSVSSAPSTVISQSSFGR